METLIVVGGGPAGMAAAIEAAGAGLSCALVDEAPEPGGQIYRLPPKAFQVSNKKLDRGDRLRLKMTRLSHPIKVHSNTSAFGIWEGHEILWSSGQNSGTLKAEQIILATGAHERSIPFPGWTLPGVMAAGGAKNMMKVFGVRPGRRAVIAGTGPILIIAAQQLRELGVEVAGILEAGSRWWSFGEENSPLFRETREREQALLKAGIPLLFHHTIFAAHGVEEVERVTYGPVHPEDWSPIPEGAITVDADLLLVSFGFVPNIELAGLAGCRLRHDPEIHGWVPVRNALMESTVPGIFCVGDGAGMVGALGAEEEGRVAGITAAEKAGLLTSREAKRRRSGPLRRLRSLLPQREALKKSSRIRNGLLKLAHPETVICRCEEVSLAEVEEALKAGAKDLQSVKLFTRLGMGPCQGRNCALFTAMWLKHSLGGTYEQIGEIHPRPPIRPVTLGALAQRAERQ